MSAALPNRIPNYSLSYRIVDPRQRLIVALDVSSASAARKIVAAVGDSALTYKVGMQLYTAEGPQVVRDLVKSGTARVSRPEIPRHPKHGGSRGD